MDGVQFEIAGGLPRVPSVIKTVALAILLVMSGCAGSGSEGSDDPLKQGEPGEGGVVEDGSDRDIEVRGTVRGQGAGIEDLQVCALGECDTTDENGSYSLEVPGGLFRGGDVLFSFEGDGIDAQTVARDLPGGGEDAVVDFEIRNGQAAAVSVRSGGRGDDDIEGDNDEQVEVSGTVRSAGGAAQDLEVCALGECDSTDEGGAYSLTIPANVFPGGDVLFSFEGDGLTMQTVAQDLPGNNRDAIVNFVVTREGIAATEVRAGVSQDDDDNNDVSDGDITVGGVVRSTSNNLDSITVCALGNCDTLDPDGSYRLEVPRNVFGGGDVLFSFEGPGINTQTVARDLPGNNQDARVDFDLAGNRVSETTVIVGGQVDETPDIENSVDDETGA